MEDKLSFGAKESIADSSDREWTQEEKDQYRKKVESGNPKGAETQKEASILTKHVNNNGNKKKEFEPNLQLLNDAIRDEMPLMELADKYYDSPQNIMSKIRNDLNWLTWKENKVSDSRYLRNLEVIIDFRDTWLALLDLYAVRVEFQKLPIHQKFEQYFKGLSYESQQNLIAELSFISEKEYERNKKKQG